MKKITIFTMQLKNPGGIECFVSTITKMFCNEYKIEIVANYGKSSDTLAFSLPKNVSLVFLSPVQPQEISMKQLIIKLKWYKIPKELKRRFKINSIRNHVFKKYLIKLNTDYIITDRALYSNLVNKYYRGTATKIATDHNYHQNNQHYISKLINSIQGFNYLIVATDELKKDYEKLTEVKCLHINNPLNSIPSKKAKLKSKNLISVGRFVPEKDFETLVDIMAKVYEKDPDTHLTIIGNGITFPSVKAKIKKLNLENTISLPGYLSQKEIEKYYYNSSLFVMTSKTEAFGLVLTEAMSYGLPCIAFDRASGARAQINSQNGFLIPNGDIEKMAEKILSVLNNPLYLKTLQKTIDQEIKQKYNPKIIKKEWEKLLN